MARENLEPREKPKKSSQAFDFIDMNVEEL